MPDAYEDGVRLLTRRSLTRREVVERLGARPRRRRVEDAVSPARRPLRRSTTRLARHWIASQAAARGRGRDRAWPSSRRAASPSRRGVRLGRGVEDGPIDEDAALARRSATAGRPPAAERTGTAGPRVQCAA
jgi:hypothetical protein